MHPRTLPEHLRRAGAPRPTMLAATLVMAPIAGLAGCLCPPAIEEIADLGFRSPAQTFRTFQLAVRADSPLVEYRCLSVDFRRRNSISQLTWREFREEWFAGNPFLKRGVAKAEIVSEERLAPDRHELVAEAYGRRFAIELAREGFYQIYSGERLYADDLLPDQRGLESYVGAEELPDSRALVAGAVEVSRAEVPAEMSELRIGLEWKIDDIRSLDPD